MDGWMDGWVDGWMMDMRYLVFVCKSTASSRSWFSAPHLLSPTRALPLPPSPPPFLIPSFTQTQKRLGLNLEIDDGKLAMLEPFVVCTEGKPISPEQAKLMVRLN